MRACDAPGCDLHSGRSQYCKLHRQRLSRTGLLEPVERPEGTVLGTKGYRFVVRRGHPNAYPNGQIAEHRFVMAEALGRPLAHGENVHHLNGDRLDNRIENLELWTSSQPIGQRVEDKVLWAKEILALYGDDFVQPSAA